MPKELDPAAPVLLKECQDVLRPCLTESPRQLFADLTGLRLRREQGHSTTFAKPRLRVTPYRLAKEIGVPLARISYHHSLYTRRICHGPFGWFWRALEVRRAWVGEEGVLTAVQTTV